MLQLDRLLKERSISTMALAELTGIPKQTIDAYRQNRRNLSLVNALRISAALGVSPSDLVDKEDWQQPEDE